jgi:ATP-dependent exoDNAse (exonuclease V) beta subunit
VSAEQLSFDDALAPVAAATEERPPPEELPLVAPDGEPFRPAQVAAIESREGPGLVEATAGSGKTAVLVERLVRAILVDETPPAQLLAITFTDKAASELRGRVRERLRALGGRETARAAEASVITTIHGFCARLLRAHPLAAGIDPGFRVLDDGEARRLRREAAETTLRERALADPATLELAAAYRADGVIDLVIEAHGRLRSQGERAPRLPLPKTAPTPPGLARVRLEAATAPALAELALGELKSVITAREKITRAEALLGRTEPDEIPGAALLDALSFKPGKTKALGGDACREYLAALGEFRAACVDTLALAVAATIDALLADYGVAYEAAKSAAGALDYDDLELAARDLLLGDAEIRRATADRFELLMVDEFQDTNPLQLDVIELIERDNLFVVGDEFQAIYGFRHADVAIFRGLRAEHEPHGRALSLAESFRALPDLLTIVNATFSDRFSGFTPMVATRDPGAGDEPRVELLVTDSDAWTDDALEPIAEGLPRAAGWRAAEARLLAQRLRDLVDDGQPAGGIAVLLRALTAREVYARAIEAVGLRVYAAGGRGYWSRRDVADLLAFLKVIANPADGLALFEVLASPLGGCTSDALTIIAAHARAQKRDPWRVLRDAPAELMDALPAADADRLAQLVPWLAAERAAAPRRAIDELLERAIDARGYDLHLLSLPGAERRAANVRKLLRLARAHEARAGAGVRAFVDVVERELDLGADTGEAPVDTPELDAVRLMTIHAAKGLEFDVVAVADLGRPPRNSLPGLLVDGDKLGLKLRALDGGEGVDALAREDLATQARAEMLAEEDRILYVAMTRAKDRLLLSGGISVEQWPVDHKTPCPLAWLGPALDPDVAALDAETPERDVVVRHGTGSATVRVRLNAPSTVGAVLRVPAGAATGDLLPATAGPAAAPPLPAAPPPAPIVRTLSYTGLHQYEECAYRFYLQRVLRLPEVAAVGLEPGGGARRRGTLVHTLLERLDLGRPRLPDVAAVHALAAVDGEGPLDAEIAEEVAAAVATFAATPLAARLAAARGLRREAAFAVALTVGEDSVVLDGFIDAIADEGDGRVLIVDYKTDKLDPEADAEAHVEHRYAIQRDLYALAALRNGAAEVEVVYALTARPDEPVSSVHRAADADALAARLSDLAAGALGGRFPVAAEPHVGLCAGCPGRAALCSHDEALTGRVLPLT